MPEVTDERSMQSGVTRSTGQVSILGVSVRQQCCPGKEKVMEQRVTICLS